MSPRFKRGALQQAKHTLGTMSTPLNVFTLVYLAFMVVTMNMPTRWPVTAANMNYISVTFGSVMLAATVLCYTVARHQFMLPQNIHLVDRSQCCERLGLVAIHNGVQS